MPVNVAVGPIKLTSLAVKIAEKPWSQSWRVEIRLRFTKAGKRLIEGHLNVAGEKVNGQCGMHGLMIRLEDQLECH